MYCTPPPVTQPTQDEDEESPLQGSGTQPRHDDVDLTVPRQLRVAHRYGRSTPVQPPPRQARPRRGQ